MMLSWQVEMNVKIGDLNTEALRLGERAARGECQRGGCKGAAVRGLCDSSQNIPV